MWLWPIGSIVLGRPRPGLPSRGPVVDLGDELVELCLGEVLEAGAFRKVFANPAVEVLVRAALPGGVRVGEVCRDSEGVGELVVERELGSVVGSHGRDRVCGQRLVEPDLCVQGGPRGWSGQLGCVQESGAAFHGRV